MKETDHRHKLIQEEFRPILSNRDYLTPELIESIQHTDGVVVLSAAPLKDARGNIIAEDSPENVARIEVSADLVRNIAAWRLGRRIGSLSEEELLQFGPLLILNGETEQLEAMHNITVKQIIPDDKIIDLDCGQRGKANTKTQFEVINRDPRLLNVNHLTLVSSGYHIPRVARTAAAQLSPRIGYDVVSVPHSRYHDYNVFKTVRGEVKRIERYMKTGDIAVIPTR